MSEYKSMKKTRKTQAERDADRIKSIGYCMRMSPGQRAAIEANMKTGNYTNMNEYLLDMGLNGYVIAPTFDFTKPISECAYQLQKIGTNVNQIAHRVNRTDVMNDNDFAQLNSLIQECYKAINSAFDFFLNV